MREEGERSVEGSARPVEERGSDPLGPMMTEVSCWLSHRTLRFAL